MLGAKIIIPTIQASDYKNLAIDIHHRMQLSIAVFSSPGFLAYLRNNSKRFREEYHISSTTNMIRDTLFAFNTRDL
jgi:hypothetical protein